MALRAWHRALAASVGPGGKPSTGPGAAAGPSEAGEGPLEGRGPGPRGRKLGGQWDQRVPADTGLLGRALGSGLGLRPSAAPRPPLELGAL